LAGDVVVVGTQGAGELEAISVAEGRVAPSIAPRPGTPILGGHTEPHSADIMGGKAPRALLWSAALGRLLVTSVGPNIGPNPQRMEVSANGGGGVVDVARGVFERPLGFGGGGTEGMALDGERGRLYVGGGGLGLGGALRGSPAGGPEAAARKALLWSVPIPPPAGFPLARPAADYGVNGRAGVELHSGPRALVLAGSGQRLFVLDRFTATLAVLEGVDGTSPRLSRQ